MGREKQCNSHCAPVRTRTAWILLQCCCLNYSLPRPNISLCKIRVITRRIFTSGFFRYATSRAGTAAADEKVTVTRVDDASQLEERHGFNQDRPKMFLSSPLSSIRQWLKKPKACGIRANRKFVASPVYPCLTVAPNFVTCICSETKRKP